LGVGWGRRSETGQKLARWGRLFWESRPTAAPLTGAWSGQHRGQTSRRAVAKANGLTAEISFRTKLIQAGYTECQELPPFTRWPVPMRKKWGYARIGLPADVEDGNSGQSCSESSEGLETRQEDP